MAEISDQMVQNTVSSLEASYDVKSFRKYDSGFARDVLEVKLESGDSLIVYLCTNTSTEYERRFMKEEKLVELVNQKTDIPTQKILKSDFSKKKVPYLFYIAEKIEGYDPQNRFKYLPREIKRNIVKEAGEYLGELHKKVEFDSAGEIIYKNGEIEIEEHEWKEYLKQMAFERLEELENTRFSDMVEDARQFVDQHIDLADTNDYFCCIHWDVSPNNLIVKDDHINAVIDWEKAISGPPEWDLANSRVSMIYRWFETESINQELEREFFRGYRNQREFKGRWKQRITYYSMIQNFEGMKKFENWTEREGLSQKEVKEEEEFFRQLFRKRQKNLKKAAEKEISYDRGGELMKIRRYKDKDNIRHLIRAAVEDIELEYYSKEQQRHLEEVIPDMNLEFAEKDRYVYFVAVKDGEIVGVAGFQKESGTVAGIFVDPDLKGSGIGSKLMQKLEEKAREENLEEMETLASLEAIDFYRKNGYEVTEERKQDIEGRDIGVKVMIKEL